MRQGQTLAHTKSLGLAKFNNQIFIEMNTTIIKANKATRLQVMEMVSRKLSRASRPVVTFLQDEDTMVISGCPSSILLSAMSQRLFNKIQVVRYSSN